MSLWHGHGDMSLYGTLVKMVNQKYAIGQGNWGAYSRFGVDPPAGYRYSEVKLAPWVDKLAFEYYKYVPWEEIEQDSEPLYLPSPVPLGLIGDGIIEGIAFHRTVIPKYSFEDLITRCISLLENKPPEENIIKPLIRFCTTTEVNKQDYLDLLTKGYGQLNIIPNGEIKKNHIVITGRSPFRSFNSLLTAVDKIDKKTKKRKLNVYIDDKCGKDIELIVTPINKSKTDINKLAQEIWSKYIISKSKFTCYTCNDKGLIDQLGIDDLIKLSYNHWELAALNKKIFEFNKINEKKFDVNVIEVIRPIFEKYKSYKVDDIIKHYKLINNGKNQTVDFDQFDPVKKIWSKVKGEINESDIRKICAKKSIQSLIEHKLDINKINNELKSKQKSINDNDNECFTKIKGMV